MIETIKIAWPPRRADLAEEDKERLKQQQLRGRALYDNMKDFYSRNSEVKVVSPRQSEAGDLLDRAWIDFDDDGEGPVEGGKEYMYLGVDVVNGKGVAKTGRREDFIGVTSQGKLLPPILRSLGVEVQEGLLDGMEAAFASIQEVATDHALQR